MITPKMELWLSVISLVMFVVSLLVMPMLVARIPVDYFVRSEPSPLSWQRRHPLVRWTLRVLKNLCGVMLLVPGVVMLFTPGQGILTVLVGMSLMDFPGKRKFELWLIRRPRVLATINWLRQKSRQPPVQLPLDHDTSAR
jgi:putative transmembrane protein PGPGW